jgi:hypothetical protein
MKKNILGLLMLLLVGPVWAMKPETGSPSDDLQSSLNVASYYLDSVFRNTQTGLELISSTPEAGRGDWNGIKRYLRSLKAELPGVYFYVVPGGGYSTVTGGDTNLNLSDRAYFKSLFAGNAIKGFPIYSRSTGKKSALVAVPIYTDGKVTGALGASVFLDELNKKLRQIFSLPQDYTWFVLDSKGNTMLDKDSDYIFMNALTQGSKSLQKAVSQALKNESGSVRYELGEIRRGYYKKLPHMDWRLFLVKVEQEVTPTPPQLRLSLERFVPDLQHKLDRIGNSIAETIGKSHVGAIKESDVRKLLQTIFNKNTDVINAGFVNASGILRYLEPRDYRNFENADISSQEHVVAMQKDPRPTLSGAFKAVEDFLAVVVAYPLFDNEKQYMGAVTILIRPELFIDALLKKSTIPENYELWVMQPDNGMIIYDQDREEIGRMLFTDPLYRDYRSLLELGREIAAHPSGQGSYVFFAPGLKEKVIKKAVWQTVRLYNREWRVVLVRRPYEKR